MDKSKFKKFLMTASALAVVTGSSSSAWGAQYKDDDGGAVALVNGVAPTNSLKADGGAVGGTVWAVGDSYFYEHDQDLELGNGAGTGATVGTIDVNNHVVGITVVHDSSVGSIISSGGGARADLVVNDGKKLTLTTTAGLDAAGNPVAGGIYTGLGAVVLGSGGGAGTLEINSGKAAAPIILDAATTIDSDVASSNGIIAVLADKGVTFKGAIGATKSLATMTMAAGSAVRLEAAAIFDAGGNGVVMTGDTTALTVKGGVNFTGKINGAGANSGLLNVEGVTTFTGAVGSAGALKKITTASVANGGTGGVVAFTAAVKAETLSIEHAASDVRLAGNFTGKTVFGANGLLKAADTVIIDGDITTTSATDATGTGGGQVKFAANGEIKGAIGTVTDAVGGTPAVNQRLELVEVTGDGVLGLSGANKNHYAKTFKFGHANSGIAVAAGSSVNGNAVSDGGADRGTIAFLGAGSFNGRLGDDINDLGAVVAAGAGTVNISAGNHKVTEFNLNAAGTVFAFADGANITGKLDNTIGGGVGSAIANFAGSGSVSGTVGQTQTLTELNLNGDKDSKVSFAATIKATNINIGAGTMELNGAAASNITGTVNFTDAAFGGTLLITANEAHTIGQIKTVADGGGTVSITAAVASRTITFGQVGDHANTKALNLLSLDSGAGGKNTVIIAGNSNIKEINVGNGGGILKFNTAGATYKIGNIVDALGGKGDITISENTTFESATGNAAVSFGTAIRKLGKLSIADGKSLTIGDGISIYSTESLAIAANSGVIVASGTSTLSFGTQGVNKFNTLTATGGADKVLTLVDAMSFNGAVTVGAGTLEVKNNITAANIKANVANVGTLKFSNDAAATVTGTVGAGGSFNEIQFSGANVTFTNDVTHTAGNSFKFNGSAATTVTFSAGTDVGANAFINDSAVGVTHTVVLNKDNTNFTGQILGSADGTKLINFQLNDLKNAKLSGAVSALGANFTTGENTKGELEFNSATAAVNSVGAAGKKVALVTFTTNGEIKNGLYSVATNVTAGKTATIGGIIASDSFTLAAANSTVNISDGATVNSAITTGAAGEGVVNFAGNAALKADIGISGKSVNTVAFGDDATKTVAVNTANVFAATTTMKKGVVDLAQDFTVNSTNTTTNSTTLSLHDKKLNIASGTLTLKGDNIIAIDVTATTSTASAGQVIAKTGTTLEYDPAATILVRANDTNNARPTGGASREFALIVNSSGTDVAAAKALTAARVAFDNNNDFITYSARVVGNGGLSIIQQDNARQVLTDNLGGGTIETTTLENVVALTNAPASSGGARFVDVLASLPAGDRQAALDRLLPVTLAADAVEDTTGAVSNTMVTHLGDLSGGSKATKVAFANTDGTSGISAGDEEDRFGLWASPFFNRTTQKARKQAAGYSSDSIGASFGFDTKLNDDMILGAAFTVVNDKMKYKDFKSGDKTDIKSLMFSIYARQQLTENWFGYGVVTFGSNDIRNSEKRISGPGTSDTVSGNYTSMSFNGEGMFGYNFVMDQVVITPSAGLRYGRVNSGGYKETGSTTGQNLTVSTKASNKLEVVAGARVSGIGYDMNGATVTPEIRGFVNYDLIGKNGKQSVNIDGATLTAKSSKPARTTFTVGLGVNADYGMMTYGANYDLSIGDKLVGHTGSLMVRVNF